MRTVNEYFTLSNGIKMPKLGLGNYKLNTGDETYNAVLTALNAGIRHIDSAIIYLNEVSVGQAIRDSGISREDIFITSKVPPHIKNFNSTLRMFEKSLKNLGTDYIDLYIINAPGPFNDLDGDYDKENIEVYKALEMLYNDKRVRAIGVSQFKINDIENILNHCTVKPHVQQMSFFIGHTQNELVHYCQSHHIQVQAFSPLAKGYLLTKTSLNDIAIKYKVSPAQLALKYIIQKEIAPIPKATLKAHITLNTQLDFTITEEDMITLDNVIDDPRQYDD